jgi:hypothetical protein
MTFFERYTRLRGRLSQYKLKADFETVKTASVINALADRSMTLIEMGEKRNFVSKLSGMSQNVYPSAETVLEWAEQYMDKLEEGEFPFSGEFTEPGYGIVDHTFIQKDGKLHVFYNRATTGYGWWDRSVDTIGHSVTTDLINWTIEPPVLGIGNKNFDDYQVWSPGVIFHNGKYKMYYTGVNYNVAQSCCLAESDDLYKRPLTLFG